MTAMKTASVRRNSKRNGVFLATLLLVAGAGSACDTEESKREDASRESRRARSTGDAGTDAGEAGRDAGGSEDEPPLYVVGTRVWDDTTTTSYFHVTSSLEEGTEIDPRHAREVSGPAKLYAIEGVGWFAIGGGEEPTITRYTLDEQDGLVEQETISLQPQGVRSLWDSLYVVSPTKMYYPDRDNAQLIVIDPTEMAVEGVVELPETMRDGYLSHYGYTPHLRDGKLLFSVGWFDWDNDKILGETGLVVLDTETDELTRFDVDDRCGGITTSVVTESGDAYFVSSALAGAAYHIDRLATEPCALRIRAGEDAFDSTYLVHLDDVTGGAIAGEPVPAGGSALFLRVFDEALATVEDGAATWDLTGQAAWRWWRWDVASGEAARIEGLAPSTSDVLWFQVDGRVFGTETTEDHSETTLIELTAEGGPRRALTAPGFLHGVARVR